MLVELDVAVAHALGILIGDFRHLLAGLVHEVMLDEPLAHELLRELTLGFTLGKLLLVAVGIEVAAGVGRVDLVDEVHLAITLSELILRVDEDETLAGSYLLTTSEETARVVFHHGVVLSRDNALSDNLLARDVQVVTLVGLRGRRDDGLWEALVLTHSIGQTHAADLADTFLIVAPGRTRKDAADDHLHAETLALQTNGHHRVGRGQLPIGADVAGGIEELGGNLVEYLTFKGNALREDDVESRDAVGSHHHHEVVIDVVYIANFTVVNTLLSFELEISFC